MVILRDFKEVKGGLIRLGYMIIGICLVNGLNMEGGMWLGMLLLLGGSFMITLIGHTRSLEKIPIQVQLHEDRLHLTFQHDEEEDIDIHINQLTHVVLKVHSRRTAILEFYDANESNKYKLQLHKKMWTDFEEFVLSLARMPKYTPKFSFYRAKSDNGTELIEFDHKDGWYSYLLSKHSIKSAFKEIMSEGIVKKILALLGFVIFFSLKAISDDLSSGLELLPWFWGIGLTYYFVVSFIYRLKGYSGSEALMWCIVVLLRIFGLTYATLSIFLRITQVI